MYVDDTEDCTTDVSINGKDEDRDTNVFISFNEDVLAVANIKGTCCKYENNYDIRHISSI